MTAVVVDEWPLIRLGMAEALRAAGIRVIGESQQGEDGVRRAVDGGATFLVLGTVRDMPTPELVSRARAGKRPPRVVVLLDQIRRDDLASVVAVGVDGVLVRSLRPDELTDALGRIRTGERVVAPALLPLLVGLLGPPEEGGPARGPLEGPLTRKELEVLARLAEGRSNREIAGALYVTPATVKTHLAHIYTKLGVGGRQEALARAVALGLLT